MPQELINKIFFPEIAGTYPKAFCKPHSFVWINLDPFPVTAPAADVAFIGEKGIAAHYLAVRRDLHSLYSFGKIVYLVNEGLICNTCIKFLPVVFVVTYFDF